MFVVFLIFFRVEYTLCCTIHIYGDDFVFMLLTDIDMMIKGVFGGPSGPSREGPGVGHKIVSDTKQMTKERKKKKKNEWEKGKMCKEKKWKKEREKNGQK